MALALTGANTWGGDWCGANHVCPAPRWATIHLRGEGRARVHGAPRRRVAASSTRAGRCAACLRWGLLAVAHRVGSPWEDCHSVLCPGIVTRPAAGSCLLHRSALADSLFLSCGSACDPAWWHLSFSFFNFFIGVVWLPRPVFFMWLARSFFFLFLIVLFSLQSSTALPPHPPHPPSSTRAARSPFTALAATASADITRTSTKLATLTRLASRTSLFDDPSAEIAALTSAIKADLARLHVTLTQLGELRGAAATPQAGLHSSSVVDGLKARLGSTASGFQTVLKLRTESLAAAEARRSRFQKPAPPPAPGGPRVGAPRTAAASAGGGAGSVAIDLGGGSLGAASAGGAMEGGVGGGGGGAMRQQLVSRPTENAYAASRADAVQQVETTIVELGQIFNQLATMVSEQGEVVERIDANTEEVARNVSAGHGQLIEYYNSVASNRGLILKVFGVLFAFLILWVFMA